MDLELDGEADWLVAISKTLARQSTYNNVISEMLKGITRIVGWLLLTLVRIQFSKPEPNNNSIQFQPKNGFDTIISVHTPHHTPTKSASTRNKGSRDLKFCMQLHLTKLTTIQENF